MPQTITHIHHVISYRYAVDGSTGMPGPASLLGKDGKERLSILVVADTATVPKPTIKLDKSWGKCWLRESTFALLVDMLRNESPVVINFTEPGMHVSITTSSEPVGAGDE